MSTAQNDLVKISYSCTKNFTPYFIIFVEKLEKIIFGAFFKILRETVSNSIGWNIRNRENLKFLSKLLRVSSQHKKITFSKLSAGICWNRWLDRYLDRFALLLQNWVEWKRGGWHKNYVSSSKQPRKNFTFLEKFLKIFSLKNLIYS